MLKNQVIQVHITFKHLIMYGNDLGQERGQLFINMSNVHISLVCNLLYERKISILYNKC